MVVNFQKELHQLQVTEPTLVDNRLDAAILQFNKLEPNQNKHLSKPK